MKHLEESAADAAEQRAASLNHPVKSENEGYRVDRAGVLRARRAYEQMQKVGSREMQKKTYAQLQEAESKLGEKERSRFGGAPAGTGLAGQGRPGIAGPAGGGSPYRSAASSGDSFRLK